ncbi:putative gamma-cysteine synthetase regulatory subunit [Microthyrium microscopicum]|uniref:GCS light chain n=1 Tax=Microthyrium microscopicum TaxID=703497 RepID=A0A6A6UH02_9PEZI|nr:putative gamma-cysteine synthetase regulatory subunit [Microthyrium microscopicum]
MTSATPNPAAMNIILSTSNIMGNGPSILARNSSKSNAELTASLRANFDSANTSSRNSWTTQEDAKLLVPTPRPTPGLAEDRDAYDITVKLFYLPHTPPTARCQHTRDALQCVLDELHITHVDLLIVSFPGITFDADDESDDLEELTPNSTVSGSTSPVTNGTSSTDLPTNDTPEHMDSVVRTYRTLEALHDAGVTRAIGLSEFGTQRLAHVLAAARIAPSVDQINVRDCCVVPRPLIVYAKEKKIELLTHNDCTDILPEGTLRELLGPGETGAGVLAAKGSAVGPGLHGEVRPLWVVKYTAVVKNRGVVENKGYFAAADLVPT